MAAWPYSTRQWQRVRANQLRREPLCRACKLEGNDTLAREVDHIKPVNDGGAPFDPANLQSLCTPHHSIKTGAYDKQGKDWREWEQRGCDEHGNPRDPNHAWNTGGDQSPRPCAGDRRGPSENG